MTEEQVPPRSEADTWWSAPDTDDASDLEEDETTIEVPSDEAEDHSSQEVLLGEDNPNHDQVDVSKLSDDEFQRLIEHATTGEDSFDEEAAIRAERDRRAKAELMEIRSFIEAQRAAEKARATLLLRSDEGAPEVPEPNYSSLSSAQLMALMDATRDGVPLDVQIDADASTFREVAEAHAARKAWEADNG